MPRMRSITMTSWRQRSQYTSGTCSSGLPAKLRLSCEALPASRIRSSSFRIVFSYSTTTSRGRRRRESGQYSSARPASACSTSRSRSIASRMPGRSTLTTTSRPSGSVAACTWAMDAAASGATSKLANSPATGRPSDASMRALASVAVEGRDAVLELRELVGDVGRQQVAPRRDHLAELHEDRPEVLERAPQALAARAAPAREPGPGREPEHEAQRPVEVGRAHEVVEPVAHQHAVDGEQPSGDAHRDQAGPRARIKAATRASRRSTASRSRSTSSRNSSTSSANRQVAALLGQVLRGVARERVARALAEVRRLAREAREVVRRDVAGERATAPPRGRAARPRAAAGNPPRSRRRRARPCRRRGWTSPHRRWRGAGRRAACPR